MKKLLLLLLVVLVPRFVAGQAVVDNPLKTAYGSFSILGDSYSTFYGYTDPVENGQWYPHLSVTKLNQTWWKLIEAETGIRLEQNNSWSGTTICNTSWNGTVDTRNSFAGRCKNLREAGLIVVEGGTNDNNAGSPIGDYIYSGWTFADLKTFRGATSYVLAYLMNKYPDSQVVFMLNNGLRDDINSSVEEICNHLGVPLFKIDNIYKEDDHPTAYGMVQIKDQFIEFLNNLNGWITLSQDKNYNPEDTYEKANVSLKLYLDKGRWNGICLPMDMNPEMIKDAFGADAKLAVYDSMDGNVMKFSITNEIKAGKPYLLMPSVDVNNPICMTDVSLQTTVPQKSGDDRFSVTGTFSMKTVSDSNTGIMLLDGDGTLYHQPLGNIQVRPFGIYFECPDEEVLSISIDGEEQRIPDTPNDDVFTPSHNSQLHLPAVPLVAADPYMSIWSGSENLYEETTQHWSGNDKSIMGFVRVDGQLYRFMGQNSRALDLSNAILPSSYWTSEKRYTVPCMVFKKTTPGSTDVVQGVPDDDASGRKWFEPDYELTDGTQTWTEATSPFSSDATVNGQPSFQWTTYDVSADIYFRRTFTLNKTLEGDIYLACGHDDSPSEIYINGTLINIPHDHGNNWNNQEMYKLSAEERSLIKTDGTPNVIAVHVHNNYGGAFADCGLYGITNYGSDIFATVDSGEYQDNTEISTATQKSLNVSAAQTYYTFQAGPIDLDVVFSSPQLTTDPLLFSTPINYISYRTKSNDGKEHDVQIYISTTPQLASGTTSEPIDISLTRDNGLLFGKCGTTTQNMGSTVMQNWGYAYLVADPLNSQTLGVDDSGQMVFRHDMGTADSGSGFTMIGYDDDQRSIYMNGYQYSAYWTTAYRNITDAFADYATRYNDIMRQIKDFDTMVYADAYDSGGEKYAELCATSYRQIASGNKLAVNNDGRMLMYNIDSNVTNHINSVDICYAAAPLFLTYNPEMAVALVASTYDYVKVTNFKSQFGNPPHHFGIYPMIGNYGLDNGADTSSSLVIIAGAAAKAAGNADIIDEGLYEQVKAWADFCDLFTLPEYAANFITEGSCDNYSGTIIRDNANLRAKCTLAMVAVAEIAKMKGRQEDAEKYMALAQKWLTDWKSRYTADGHYKQGSDVEWGLKYNLYYDRLFGSNLFDDIIKTEIEFYKDKINDTYGIPMDARWDNVAKTHETMMTAAMTESAEDFEMFMQPCYDYINESTGTQPLADTYNCVSGSPLEGYGRPVSGMFWAKVLIDRLESSGTGISIPDINEDKTIEDKRIYNINGQYMGTEQNALPKGVYIIGKRKVVVK